MPIENAPPLGVAILSLLEERDMHPYDMIQTLRSRKEDQWVKLTTGSLYHHVERLAEKGLTEAVGTEQEGNRPPRTTYRLTAAGHESFTRWVTVHLTHVENPYFAFSLALGEVSTLSPEQVTALLSGRILTLEREMTDMREGIELALSADAERIWLLAHEHKLALLTSERDYVASLVQDIESKELAWPTHP